MRTNLDEMASNTSDGVEVDRERCARATFMHSAIENHSMLQLKQWLDCRGIKRSGTKSLFMIISHNCQSCVCRHIWYEIGLYSITVLVMLHIPGT